MFHEVKCSTMLSARCKSCNKELHSNSKIQYCGCPNQMYVVDDKVGANDLDKVVLTNSIDSVNKTGVLSSSDLQYQENRRKRKVRRLDFEER